MVLKDLQRDALKNEITGVIMDNQRTSVIMLDELIKDRSELFVMCWNDYQEQNDVFILRRPFYVPDERGTFGFMRLRDDDGRVLGYEGNADDDPTDEHYKPTPADKRKITAIMESGTPLYYYIGDQLAVSLGVVLTEYTEPAVYEYERKRHRRFDLNDQNPNNSAPYMALFRSYFTQYQTISDLPTLTAGTDARKGYYVRMLQRTAKGEITINEIRRLPRGKGLRPKEWKNGIPDDFDFTMISTRMATGYNCFVHLNGNNGFPSDESDIYDGKMEPGLFWRATR